jgi:hypothetical protein
MSRWTLLSVAVVSMWASAAAGQTIELRLNSPGETLAVGQVLTLTAEFRNLGPSLAVCPHLDVNSDEVGLDYRDVGESGSWKPYVPLLTAPREGGEFIPPFKTSVRTLEVLLTLSDEPSEPWAMLVLGRPGLYEFKLTAVGSINCDITNEATTTVSVRAPSSESEEALAALFNRNPRAGAIYEVGYAAYPFDGPGGGDRSLEELVTLHRQYPGVLDDARIKRLIETKRLVPHIGRFVPGDVDRDGDVDLRDLSFITSAIQQRALVNGDDERDLNHDLRIDALDQRVLVTLCTRPRCATQ